MTSSEPPELTDETERKKEKKADYQLGIYSLVVSITTPVAFWFFLVIAINLDFGLGLIIGLLLHFACLIGELVAFFIGLVGLFEEKGKKKFAILGMLISGFVFFYVLSWVV